MTDKEFFDWMRGFQEDEKLSQAMVDGANTMLALMPAEELRVALGKVNNWETDGSSSLAMSFSTKGNEALKAYEKFVGKPYLDIAKVWTIGYGNTYYEDRRSVKPNDRHITEPEAATLKNNIINMDFAPAINLIFAEQIAAGMINQNMFDALVQITYNIGVQGMAGSNIATQLKAGKKLAAADAFLPWNKVRKNGRLEFSQGLHNRRVKERALFLS